VENTITYLSNMKNKYFDINMGFAIAINLRKLCWLQLSFSPQEYNTPFTKLFIFLVVCLPFVFMVFMSELHIQQFSDIAYPTIL